MPHLMPRHFPASKLLPLPTPQCLGAHLPIDFITDFPESQGNTLILVVTDQFPQSFWLIQLPMFPAAYQLAEILFHQVFRYGGVPEGRVSDCGPQFILQVCDNFMEKLGVTASLTSGYLPQANSQVERINQEVGRFLRTFFAV